MAQEFKLPDLGEGIESGDVVNVMVSEGDTVSAEQTILEVETDKAVLEVPCPFAGKVTKVHVSQGDKVPVGATLISVETNGEAGGDEAAPAREAQEEEPEKKEPEESKPEAREKEEKKEEPAEPKSEKAKPEKQEPDKPSKPEQRKAEEEPAEEKPSRDEPVPAGPATRRLARELGVDLAAVADANPDERLTEKHVKAFVRDQKGARPAPGGGDGEVAAPSPELPDFTQWGSVERVPFSSLQRKTADHLSTGWRLAPHVTQFDEADVTALDALRKRYRDTEQGQNVRLTVTAFVLKAVTIALKSYPEFNASLDTKNNELVLKKYYHIGMAVDTESGLIVPVLRDLDRKTVIEIANEMNEIAERTRQRKVTLDELRGGTFTVTNLGGIGGTAFTPVINYPEVAILGLGRSRQVPYVDNGSLATRLMMPLCLSYDHRVVNGADGARFVRKLATLLEDPEMLLLGG